MLCLGETPGNFDIVIENDNFEKAYEIFRNFIMANYNLQGKSTLSLYSFFVLFKISQIYN